MAFSLPMSSIPYAAALLLLAFGYLVVIPLFHYFRDPKGLRRYPLMHSLCSISQLPFMILAHTGARSTYLSKLHQTHPVIRTGPNTLSYGDPRAIKDIYGHNTPCTKDQLYNVTKGSHFHLADVVDKHDHAAKRKLLSSAYAIKNLENWEFKVADKTQKLIAHFDKCCTAPLPAGQSTPNAEDVNVDLRAWANFFSVDAIADIGMSEKLGFLDTGDDFVPSQSLDGKVRQVHFRESLYNNARKQSLLVWPYEWYTFLNHVADYIPTKQLSKLGVQVRDYAYMGRCAQDWDGIPLALTQRRLNRWKNGEKLDDFFEALCEGKTTKDGGKEALDFGEMVAEMSIMLNAGSVTTAIAITNVMYQLIKNPTILQKVREEVDAALEDDDACEFDGEGDGVASYDKVKHLPYLRACLDESLRLFPPTPQGLGRETPADGTNILGDYIPGGVSVSMSALVAHRCESVFPQSDKFIPERFLGEEGKALQPYFLTFSAGARGCIGRNISYLEQAVVVASLVRRYEFALPNPGWEMQREETMNWLLKDMPVKVWRRVQAEAEE